MSKVKLDVIKPWITTKITQILGMEDDVVVEFVYNQLEEKVRDASHLISSEMRWFYKRYNFSITTCEKAVKYSNAITWLFPLIIIGNR